MNESVPVRVPNFRKVDDYVYRSGQPLLTDWDALKAFGVKHVLKLNEYGTGTDFPRVVELGMRLSFLPISDADAQSALPNLAVLDSVDALLADRAGGPILVHCTEGKDRAGIAVARYRVRHCGWTKEAAFKEWVACGSHGYRGLVDAFNAWAP